MKEGKEGIATQLRCFAKGDSMTQSNLFKDDLFQSIFVSETLNGIEDFDAGKIALSIVVSSNPLSEFFCCYRRFPEPNVDGIYLWIICDSHISPLLNIVYVNSHYHNFVFLGSASITQLFFGVFTQADWFGDISHYHLHGYVYHSLKEESSLKRDIGVKREAGSGKRDIGVKGEE